MAGLCFVLNLICLLLLPHVVLGENVVVKVSRDKEKQPCSFPAHLQVTIVRDAHNSVTLHLTKNEVITVPNRVVLMTEGDSAGETIFQPIELPQTEVAYHSLVGEASLLAHCLVHNGTQQTPYYALNGTFFDGRSKFRLSQEEDQGIESVTEEFVACRYEMLEVQELDGQRSHDYARLPGDVTGHSFSPKRGGTPRTSSSRKKRDATNYYLDVLPVVDFALYSRWYSKNNNNRGKAIVDIVSYLTNVFTSMSLRFTTLDLSYNRHINIRMLTPHVSTIASTSWFTEDNKVEISENYNFVNVMNQLLNLTQWISVTHLPFNDHVMLFTGYEWYNDDINKVDTAIKGLAWMYTTCHQDGYSSSIVQDLLAYQSEYTAAHELGHSLGAVHDGAHNLCLAEAFYIMSAYFPTGMAEWNMGNTYKFSYCSSNEIAEYMDYIEDEEDFLDTCLLAASGSELPDAPITSYRIEDLCPTYFGDQSYNCIAREGALPYTEPYVCQSLYCHYGDYCPHVLPPSGTCCSNGKYCVQGDCVPAPAGYCVLDDKCPFEDNPDCVNVIGPTTMAKCFEDIYYFQCCTACKDRNDAAEVPRVAPLLQISVNNSPVDYSDGQALEWDKGTALGLFCVVSGGVPEVSNVTISCPGIRTKTDSGTMTGFNIDDLQPSMHDTMCTCSAMHPVLPYDETTSFVIHITPEVPPVAPLLQISVNNSPVDYSDGQALEWDKGTALGLYCVVSGGVPEVSNVTISCPGIRTKTDSGTMTGFNIDDLQPSMHGTMCTCSAMHPVLPYDETTSFVIHITPIPPPEAPVLTINGQQWNNADDVQIRLGETLEFFCSVEGGHPNVTSVTVDCPGVDTFTQDGTSVTKGLVVSKEFDDATCVCSADHVSGAYSTTASVTITVLDPSRILTFSINSISDTSQDIPVSVGEDIDFVCEAHGMPAPTQLSIKRKPSHGQEEEDIGGSISGSPEGGDAETKLYKKTMRIGCSDTGRYEYECAAFNGVGDAVRSSLSIQVLCYPHLEDQSAVVESAIISNMGQFRVTYRVWSDPAVTDFMLSKYHKRRYDGKVSFMKEFKPNEYILSVQFQDFVNTLTLDVFDTNPGQDNFYTLAMSNGMAPSLNVSFSSTIYIDGSSSNLGPEGGVGSVVNVYITAAMAALAVVSLTIGAVVYVKHWMKETKALKKKKKQMRKQAMRKQAMRNPTFNRHPMDSRIWMSNQGYAYY